MTGVEDDVIVRVAHACEEVREEREVCERTPQPADVYFHFAKQNKKGGGAHVLQTKKQQQQQPVYPSRLFSPWPKSSLALKPSTSSMVMELSILARLDIVFLACFCVAGVPEPETLARNNSDSLLNPSFWVFGEGERTFSPLYTNTFSGHHSTTSVRTLLVLTDSIVSTGTQVSLVWSGTVRLILRVAVRVNLV